MPRERDAPRHALEFLRPSPARAILTERGRDRAGHALYRRMPRGPIMPNIPTRAAATAAPSTSATTPAASTAPLKLPETGFLRQPQVLAFVPISKSTLWRRIQARTFPEPVKLSERVTVWRAEDIRRWIAEQGQPG
jgi:prophage regulatory protein